MPECVEVEITKRKLSKLLAGSYLKRIVLKDSLLYFNGSNSSSNISRERFLSNLGRVCKLDRHGKTLFFCLDKNIRFGLRLSMSGSLLTEAAFRRFPKGRARMVLEFTAPPVKIFLLDPRRFAKLTELNGLERVIERGKNAGFDILSNIVKLSMPLELSELLSQCRGQIKTLLMNQSKIAGIGNVYANEILFEAGISPLKSACRIKSSQKEILWEAARRILNRSLRLGGISMRNFFHPDGRRGTFQKEFRIYGKKKGDFCSRCGSHVKVIFQSQRSTFYCGQCQK